MMRQSPWGGHGGPSLQFPNLTTGVRNIIIANVLVYFLARTVGTMLFDDISTVEKHFGLVPMEVLRHLKIWQLVTYMFMHGGVGHLFFNMLGLYFLGTFVESAWGRKSFYQYYFLTGIGAGFLTTLLNPLLGAPEIPTVGASGAVLAVVVAFAMIAPNQVLYLFPFPIPIRAKHLAIGIAVIGGLSLVSASDGVAHVTHLTGMGIGYLFLKYGGRMPRFRLDIRGRVRHAKEVKQERVQEDWKRTMEKRIDPILDKINRDGIHTLTDEEKRILREARRRD